MLPWPWWRWCHDVASYMLQSAIFSYKNLKVNSCKFQSIPLKIYKTDRVIGCCRCWRERWQLMLQKLNNWCSLLTSINKYLFSHQLECILHVTCQRQWLLWSFLAALSVAAQETCPLSPVQLLVPILCHRCQKWRKRNLVCTRALIH